MKRPLLTFALALCLGIAAGEALRNSFTFREWLGRFVRHDKLEATVDGHGIYQSDVQRAWLSNLFAEGADPAKIATPVANEQKREALAQLIEREKLDLAAKNEPITRSAIEHEMDLLHWQFETPKPWNNSLDQILRREVAANLRGRAWLTSQLARQPLPNEKECRMFYDAHPELFREPPRFRASHLFLAAPDGYPDKVIETKRALINSLSTRLQQGESFDALVPEYSEDEATKNHGGDLNYFAAERMLPAIFAAAESLGMQKTSAPIRSRLGFHILRLTDKLPPEQLAFAQVQPEFMNFLENQNRAATVAALIAHLGGKIEFAAQPN